MICKTLECVDKLLSTYAGDKAIEQFIIDAGQSIILRFSQFNLRDMKEVEEIQKIKEKEKKEEIKEKDFWGALDIVLRNTKEGVNPIKKSFQRNEYIMCLHSTDIIKRKSGLTKFKDNSELKQIRK